MIVRGHESTVAIKNPATTFKQFRKQFANLFLNSFLNAGMLPESC